MDTHAQNCYIIADLLDSGISAAEISNTLQISYERMASMAVEATCLRRTRNEENQIDEDEDDYDKELSKMFDEAMADAEEAYEELLRYREDP
ncbi:hypothetical protein SAMN05216356_105105 [Oribacterium sp. WCC10]|nr:hypothetical protein SAMN05216356_105105 [Oribacterium sp. WCC10]